MRIEKYLFLAVLGLMTSLSLYAQEDTAFINNYKRFRSLVDPLPTYSVYLVPFQSSKKYPLSESKEYLREAYHFLRQKKVDLKRPSFIIGVLVDDLEVDDPVESYTSNNSKDNVYTTRIVSVVYRASFNILVVTKSGETLKFQLASKKEFKDGYSEYLNENYNASPDYSQRTILQSKSNKNKFGPEISDFKYEFLRLLEKYKNYYIDRVD